MSADHSSSSVLIVDDKKPNLIALGAVLEPLGARVVEADSGDEALRWLLKEDFACVLLDVQMPGLDGFETATLIKQRERTRHIPILFLTAVNREEAHIVRGYAAGAVDYLLKPFDPEVLRAKVRSFLDLDSASRKAREAARAADHDRQLLTELVTAAPVGIALFDAHCRLLRVNPCFAAIFGLSPEALGMPFLQAAPELGGEVCRGVRLVLGTGEPRMNVPWQREARGTDEPARHFLMNYSLVTSDRGIAGVGVIMTDVTERKRAEDEQHRYAAELRSALEGRDTFLSVAGHELKTPLTSIALKLDALSRFLKAEPQPAAAPRPVRDVEAMRRQVRRLSELIEDLLDVSRLGVGRLKLSTERLDLTAVVAELVARFEPDANRAGSQFDLSLGAALIGEWDRRRLEQVISNLLSNALKYGDGKPVHVETSRRGEMAVVTVRDEGIGISSDAVGRIFEKFERAVSERHFGGLGLGLYVARRIVEAMGGTIRVDSTEGQGATFGVELPIVPLLDHATSVSLSH